MKTITIHGIDDITMEQLQKISDEAGLSINKTVKKLLHEVLGIKPGELSSKIGDFEEFSGIWNSKDLSEFNSATDSLNQVDPGDWA